MKKPYNGHESWTAWNVNLWIMNEEYIYNRAVVLAKNYSLGKAAHIFSQELPARTPDGAKYSINAIKLTLSDLKN